MRNLVWATTMKYIRRNPGLSLASIVIITVTFSIGTLFLVVDQFARRSVEYLQNQPAFSIFYDQREKEENIIAFKKKLETQKGVTKVTYTTSADIQKNYLSSLGLENEQQNKYAFDANQIRILRIQLDAKVDYLPFIKLVEDEKNKGALITETVFFQDVIEKIRDFSRTVNIGSLIITTFLMLISLVLVYLTIGFTINRFSQEIEIMDLVGAEAKVIATPFVLQGAFYGFSAALLSYGSTLVFWSIAVLTLSNNLLFDFIERMLSSVGLGSLFHFSPIFIWTGLAMLTLGTLIGYSCALLATKKYIKR